MQSASSRIWTRVAVSIAYDDNHYTTTAPLSTYICCIYPITFLTLSYLGGISGLLSETSSGGLGFILVSLSTSVLINGHKELIFDIFIRPNSHANYPAGEIAILGVRYLRPLDYSH